MLRHDCHSVLRFCFHNQTRSTKLRCTYVFNQMPSSSALAAVQLRCASFLLPLTTHRPYTLQCVSSALSRLLPMVLVGLPPWWFNSTKHQFQKNVRVFYELTLAARVLGQPTRWGVYRGCSPNTSSCVALAALGALASPTLSGYPPRSQSHSLVGLLTRCTSSWHVLTTLSPPRPLVAAEPSGVLPG